MKTVVATAVVIVLLVICPARATIAPVPTVQDGPAASVEDAAQLVQQAFTDITHNDTAAGWVELEEAIAAKGFDRLPADVRYRALLVAGVLAKQNGQNSKAHDWIVRAAAFDGAGDTAWMTRLSTAFSLGKYDDAAHSVAILAQRWPDRLGDLQPGAIMQVHYELKLAQDDVVDRVMLDALFDAKWRAKGVEPSALWRALAFLCIQGNQVQRATTVAHRITSGRVALSLLVDKSFDVITLKDPHAFDVNRLVAREIEAAQMRAKAHPDQLTPVTDLQDLFLMTGQYPRVLSISDAVVAQAGHGQGQKSYTDFDDRYNWVLDNRARALQREGHWDDAVRVRVLAARRPEHGGMNVSQLINLGALYADLDQYGKAADAIIELGDMSPMGRMQLESVRLRIAVGEKDSAAIDSAMAYMREHRAEDIASWEDALLLRDELDAAAALLIERLESPAWRNEALVQMQHYVQFEQTPVQKMIQGRWDTITARADVKAAMLKVGRVGQFRVAAAPH